MRQLLPHPGDVDLLDLWEPPPPGGHRPWVVGLMASTADGAAALDGRSGPIGGDGDREVFRAVRAMADVVLVGAGTARAEGYGPVRLAPDVVARRRARGQAEVPRLAVVSGRLDLDPTLGFIAEADPTRLPLVVHPEAADPARREALADHVELVAVPAPPGGGVTGAALVAALAARGAGLVVCEGGPRLNGSLLADDVLDELSLTLDPMVVGGASPRIAVGDDDPIAREWRTVALLEHDGTLFWRLRRDRRS